MHQTFFLHKWLIAQALRSTKPLRWNRPYTSASLRDQGFALPLAVGMGLIMILVGMTMVARSQNDSVTASAQKANSGALGAAETGITRYQVLINNNRVIATYPACTSWNSSGACENTGSTPITWKNASAIPNITSCGSVSGPAVVSAQATRVWQDVDSSNASKGQYRLVDYTYTPVSPAPTNPIAGTLLGTGTLIVEGRVNQNNSVSTATNNIKVNIPVRQGNINDVPVPGLWIKTGGMEDAQTGNANKTVKGNILLNDCSVNPDPTKYQALTGSPPVPYTDPATGQPYKTLEVNINFPGLPDRPTSFSSPNILGDINSNSTLTLPRKIGSNPDVATTMDGITAYRYSINNINKANIVITPGEKVIFYLNGNIDKGVDIQHDCSTTNGCEPTNFQIYGYSSNGSLCLNGNNQIYGFVFAPNYSAGVTGTGSFLGSLWVKDFGKLSSCGSNNETVVVTQETSWNTLLNLGLKFNLPPQSSSISSWQQQEAQ